MVGRCRVDASGSGQGPVVGHCEHSNETSCSILIYANGFWTLYNGAPSA